MPTPPVRRSRSRRPPAAVLADAILAVFLLGPLAARADTTPAEARVAESKVALHLLGQDSSAPSAALCSARIAEGSNRLALLCRHDLGGSGVLTLARVGRATRSEPPFWVASLASPFEAVAELSDDALSALLAGELAIRIDTGAAGVVAEGVIGTPIFASTFDEFSLCEWTNYPCPSDGNVCTTEVCSATGVCSHQNNVDPCPLPNATGGCAFGTCGIIVSCNAGYSHCDSSQLNGCEVAHDTNSGSCQSPTVVGEQGGDLFCGPGCLGTFADLFATRAGRGEAWYAASALENSTCSANVRHYVLLDVPSGVDFDLYLYRNCVLVDSSIGGPGVDEEVEVVENESSGSDDSFTYQVEVRYFGGASCEDWSLSFVGTTCD